MIPVSPMPEPPNFNKDVRQKGLASLHRKGWDANQLPPDASKLPTKWTACLPDLWASYSAICAYLAVYLPYSTGAVTVDHFAAKSLNPSRLAYEWSNFRLACLDVNRKKREYDDVLDPFSLQPETFLLKFPSGELYPNPNLNSTLVAARTTISRLRLNSPYNMKMRAGHYYDYANGAVTEKYLCDNSPFVWYEAQRQGLL